MSTKTRWYQQDDETVTRQLSFLLAKGLSRDAALKHLEIAAPADLHGSLEHLVKRIEPSGRDPHLTARFVRQATESGGEPGKALASMLAMSTEAQRLADGLYRAIKPGLLYVTVVALVGFLVSVMWTIFVWPNLLWVYRDFDAALPALPATILNLGFLGFPLIFLLVFSLGVVLWVVARLRSRQLRELQPLQFRLFNPRLRRAANDWLTLRLCAAFQEAGVSSALALDEAKNLFGTQLNPIVGRDLALALKTDTFGEELQYQISHSGRTVETVALTGGQRELIMLRVVLFVLIGIAIISFYQPIFFMAKVI